MSTFTVAQARTAGKSTDRLALRLVPTPPASPPPRPPYYPTDNTFGPYLHVLSGSAVKLYGYLKRHANRRTDREYCDRGYDTIARDLGLSRRMAIYAERELEAHSLLIRHPWQGRYEGKRANRYTFPTPTGTPQGPARPWRHQRPTDAAPTSLEGTAKSATDCTSTSPADDQLKVQRTARVKVQQIAPIQEEKHKTRAKEGGDLSDLRAGEVPPTRDVPATRTTIATPALGAERSLSDAPAERIHAAWQPTPALDAEACRRGYYAVLGEGAVEDSTMAFRDYYDGQTLRPTRWLKWVGDGAHKHPDWPRYRAQQRAAPAPLALESWQQPAPEPVPHEDLQAILRGYKYRRR